MNHREWYRVKIGTVVGLVLCAGLNAVLQSRWMLVPIGLFLIVHIWSTMKHRAP